VVLIVAVGLDRLQDYGHRRYEETLLEQLEAPDEASRQAAADELVRLEVARAVGPLFDCGNEHPGHWAWESILQLAAKAPREAVPQLRQRLVSGTPMQKRCAALVAIETAPHGRELAPLLLDLLSHRQDPPDAKREGWVREAAARALERLGPFRGEVPRQLRRSLAREASWAMTYAMVRALAASDECAANEPLDLAPEACESLAALAVGDDADVADCALAFLQSLGSMSDELRFELRRLTRLEEPRIRARAAEILRVLDRGRERNAPDSDTDSDTE